MGRLRRLDKALVWILTPLWLVWFGLGVRTQLDGGDAVAHATSRNAMAAVDDGFDPVLTANQGPSMRQQMLDGMRGLMLDTDYHDIGDVLDVVDALNAAL